MATDAGELCHRIAVQEATEVADAAGQPTQTWATTSTVWGKYEGSGAVETLSGDQLTETVRGTVTVRKGHGITGKHRLLISGRGLSNLTVQVVGVLPPETDKDRQVLLVSQAGA